MIAEKVFAEGVAKDIRNYLPPEYEDADFQVVQKNNGIQLIGVQVNLPERNASPIIYMEQFFDEIRQAKAEFWRELFTGSNPGSNSGRK